MTCRSPLHTRLGAQLHLSEVCKQSTGMWCFVSTWYDRKIWWKLKLKSYRHISIHLPQNNPPTNILILLVLSISKAFLEVHFLVFFCFDPPKQFTLQGHSDSGEELEVTGSQVQWRRWVMRDTAQCLKDPPFPWDGAQQQQRSLHFWSYHLETLTKEDFQNCFRMRQEWWDKCVQIKGSAIREILGNYCIYLFIFSI